MSYIKKLFTYAFVEPITYSYDVYEQVCVTENEGATWTKTYIEGAEVVFIRNYTYPEDHDLAYTMWFIEIGNPVTTCTNELVTYTTTTNGYYDEVNDMAWNAGGIAVEAVILGGGYSFVPSPGIIGVVTGLTNPEDADGFSYMGMKYAFYFNRDTFKVIESGSFPLMDNQGTPAGELPYVDGDVFYIRKSENMVRYYVNGILIHTTEETMRDNMAVDLSVYASGDQINDFNVSYTVDMCGQADGSSYSIGSINIGTGTRNMSGGSAGSADYDPVCAKVKYALCGQSDGKAVNRAGMSVGHDIPLSGISYGTSTANYCQSDWYINVKLEPLDALASDYAYTESDTSLEPLDTHAESGLLTPQYASSNGLLVPIYGAGTMSSTLLMQVDGTLEPLDSLAADRPYAEVDESLAPITGIGGEAIVLDGIAYIYVPSFSITAEGTTGDPNSAYIDVPSLSVIGYTGAVLDEEVSLLSVVASGSVANMGRAEIAVPRMTIDAFGYVGSAGRAYVLYSQYLSVEAYGGATALELQVPKFSIDAAGLVGGIARAEIAVPKLTVVAEATMEDYGSAIIDVPGFISLAGFANIDVPGFSIVGHGYQEVVEADAAFVMNTENLALTEYNNYAFDNILCLGDTYYGVRADGLYELTGDTDITDAVAATFETVPSDYGDIQVKNIPVAYVTARSESKFTVQSVHDEKLSAGELTETVNDKSPYNWRVKLSRGTKAVHWGFVFDNVEGSDFQIQSFTSDVNTLGRRRR